MFLTDDGGHPRDELLLAVLHQQSTASAAIGDHLAGCLMCAERMRRLSDEDREVAALFELLDHPLPELVDIVSLPRRPQSRVRRAVMIAGSAATLALAAAATMLPSSPLHQLILRDIAPVPARTVASPPVVPSAIAETPLASGIAIHAPRSLVVELRREQQSGTVEITRTTGRDVVFRSRGGKTAYEVAPGRVLLDNETPAESFLIDLPSAVHEVRILVGQRVLLRWPEDSARFTVSQNPLRARVPLDPRDHQ